MDIGRHDYSKDNAPEWYHLSLATLLTYTWIWILAGSAVFIGFAYWQSQAEINQQVYGALLLVGYLVLFGGFAITFLRKQHVGRNHIVVILGFLGFATGFLVAIGKLLILFRGWALFRILSEPILTAGFAALIGALIFWRRTRLK